MEGKWKKYLSAFKNADQIIEGIKNNIFKDLKKYGSSSKNIGETLNYILHREK